MERAQSLPERSRRSSPTPRRCKGREAALSRRAADQSREQKRRRHRAASRPDLEVASHRGRRAPRLKLDGHDAPLTEPGAMVSDRRDAARRALVEGDSLEHVERPGAVDGHQLSIAARRSGTWNPTWCTGRASMSASRNSPGRGSVAIGRVTAPGHEATPTYPDVTATSSWPHDRHPAPSLPDDTRAGVRQRPHGRSVVSENGMAHPRSRACWHRGAGSGCRWACTPGMTIDSRSFPPDLLLDGAISSDR